MFQLFQNQKGSAAIIAAAISAVILVLALVIIGAVVTAANFTGLTATITGYLVPIGAVSALALMGSLGYMTFRE